MSALNYDVLRTAKAALDEGLIDESDYDEVKGSFLRAQQIKAGLDAGFIPEAEFTNVKRAFLESLNIGSSMTQPEINKDNNSGNRSLCCVGACEKGLKQSYKSRFSFCADLRSHQPKDSGHANALLVSEQAPVRRVEMKPADRRESPAAQASSLPPAVQLPPEKRKADTHNKQSDASMASIRIGKTEVPKDIPNLGGRRPKQRQAVPSGQKAYMR
jgi:cofilin